MLTRMPTILSPKEGEGGLKKCKMAVLGSFRSFLFFFIPFPLILRKVSLSSLYCQSYFDRAEDAHFLKETYPTHPCILVSVFCSNLEGQLMKKTKFELNGETLELDELQLRATNIDLPHRRP